MTRRAALGYGAATLLSVAAQLARLPLHPATLIPYITYVPFIVIGAAIGGLGPGLLATCLCTVESIYFDTEPLHVFGVADPRHWLGLASLALAGAVTTALFHRVGQARSRDAAASRMRAQLLRQLAGRRQMLESIIQNSPTAIALLCGPDFRFELVNPAYAALAPGESMPGRTVAEVWPSAAPLVLPMLQKVRRTQAVFQATGMAVPLHSGPGSAVEERYFDFSYVPVPGGDDTQILVVAMEVTERKRAEKELRAAHQELAAIHAAAPVALILVDDQLRVRKLNELAAQFAGGASQDIRGMGPGDVVGCLNALADLRGCGFGPSCDTCSIHLAVNDTVANGTGHRNIEAWLPVGGREGQQWRCFLVSTAPVHFNGAKKVLVCAQDLTELKYAEQALLGTVRQLRSALQEKIVLLQEIHHRVKNNLAIISSLLSMKADSAASPEIQAALQESQQRVHSMALIHEQLYGSDHFDRIDFAEYARQLVQRLSAAFADMPGRVSLELRLDPVELHIERAVPCGLILNELLSNAFKYAFPDGRHGKIAVSLSEPDPGMLELVIEDDGIGLPAGRLAFQHANSLGLRIVGILTTQLEGSLEPRPSAGTRLVLRFPKGPMNECSVC